MRWLPQGVLEFLGRGDGQVKLRGFRIELGEIEAVLRQHEGVREAVVVLREEETGDKRLVGYVVGVSGEEVPGSGELRAFLLAHLPDYMVPGEFVALEAVPLTPNGKLDREALPLPESRQPSVVVGEQQPRTEAEAVLARIWAGVLRQEQVGVQENFFELGGDSILSIQIVARANAAGLASKHKIRAVRIIDSSASNYCSRNDSSKRKRPPLSGAARSLW